jgi:hypothetical protein
MVFLTLFPLPANFTLFVVTILSFQENMDLNEIFPAWIGVYHGVKKSLRFKQFLPLPEW